MIVYQGRSLDLPHDLCVCPRCQKVELTWQGTAWRCTYTWQSGAGETKRCRYGMSLEGLFDVEGFDFKLMLGKPLSALRLSSYAVQLLHAGVIVFEWLSRQRIEQLYAAIPANDLLEEEFERLDDLIRERARRREDAS